MLLAVSACMHLPQIVAYTWLGLEVCTCVYALWLTHAAHREISYLQHVVQIQNVNDRHAHVRWQKVAAQNDRMSKQARRMQCTCWTWGTARVHASMRVQARPTLCITGFVLLCITCTCVHASCVRSRCIAHSYMYMKMTIAMHAWTNLIIHYVHPSYIM